MTYASNNGSLQATLSSRIDLDFFAPQGAPPWLIPDSVSFLAPRASLFGEAFAGKSLYALGELRLDRGEAPAAGAMQLRIEQIFLRYAFSTAASLQAGKFVTPFGSYPQRHATSSDPFIRPPLPFDFPTMITPGVVPASNNGFLDWKDTPEVFRPIGVPPVWAVPYQVGAMLSGSIGPAAYRLAAMNSAPSSTPAEWNSISTLFHRPSFVAALSVQISPALRAGASYDNGPFMREHADEGVYPPGDSPEEYKQTLYGLDATYARDHLELHGEVFADRWEMVNVVDAPIDYSYYLESKIKLLPGFYVAARAAGIRFNSITRTPDNQQTAISAKTPWDYPTSRYELGAGYQFTRAISLRGQYQWTIQSRPRNIPDNLLSIQLRIER